MNKIAVFLVTAVMLILPASIFAQNLQKGDDNTSEREYVKFTNDQKKFNDWSVSVYGGFPWLQSADFTSIDNGPKGQWKAGYDFQLSINKHINHIFGFSLLGQIGQTRQSAYEKIKARTDYFALSVLGDVNITSLFRRVDNRSTYRWGLHAYAGVGSIAYKAQRKDESIGETQYTTITKIDFKPLSSFFAQAGVGLKFKINRRLDAEVRAMYVFTGDEQFDGSGREADGNWYANIHPGNHSDNFITTSLGLTYKFGKHPEHLIWDDPLRDLYDRVEKAEKNNLAPQNLVVCVKGDLDDDGVCDDWDRELDTPKGARVDGAGRALDVDLDGVIDLYDKCVTVPGPKENFGCPYQEEKEDIDQLSAIYKGIVFKLDSYQLTAESRPILDNAAEVINKYGGGKKFSVEGHTDSRGSDAYNLKLSQKRTETVVNYLVSKGVNRDQLVPVGKGYSEPKWLCKPATVCPEWKNLENRRVVFRVIP